jgi:urea transporter
MAIALRSDGLVVEHNPALEFVDAVLRGVGQVMFQNNTYTGVLFLVGIFVNSVVFGIAALLGTIVSTATALLLGVERSLVRAGLFGFNGTLTGIALVFFLQPDPLAWVYLVVAAACSTVVMAALLNVLGKWETPALTAPFVFTTWFFLLASYQFGGLRGSPLLPAASLPRGVVEPGVPSGLAFVEGFFKGVAEVFFQDNVLTGAIFLVALLVSSRISCVAAILGSLIGLLVALALGAAEAPLRLGLYGFNPVLTAIALGGFFFVLDWKSALYAIFGCIVTTIVFAAMVAALAPMGIPTLTGPFVFTTWLFILAKPLLARLRPVAPAEATTPEGNLAAARC